MTPRRRPPVAGPPGARGRPSSPARPAAGSGPGAFGWVALAAAALAAFNLLSGLSGGLARLGWGLPAAGLATHGVLLVGGFFGTLVALERAVALRGLQGGSALAAPLAAGLGGVLAVGGHAGAAAWAWGAASLLLAGLYLRAGLQRAWSLHLRVELAAALAWGLGTLAWALGDLPAATLCWLAFLVGTIAAERRELTQFVRLPPWASRSFAALVLAGGLAVLGRALPAVAPALAPAAAAAAWLPALAQAAGLLWWCVCGLLALWLLRLDIAPRQRSRPGWVGHTGLCLTVGYGWLLAAALLALAGGTGLLAAGGAVAVVPHLVLLGFVFAMVFGHAPIILPALTGLRPRHTPLALLPLWVMAASLLLRLAAVQGGHSRWLAAAGAGHALAIALFAGVMVWAVRRGPALKRAAG